MRRLTKTICKSLMKAFPAIPEKNDPHLWETFKSDRYILSSDEIKREIRHSSSLASYEYEQDSSHSWLIKYFFPRISPKDLHGKVLLDLGCFTGGRLTAWVETYQLKKGIGIDINSLFQQAAEEFAQSKGISNIEFHTGVGENLPFADNSIDFIVSTDVFEHVEDVGHVLGECYRVLKKGGKLLVVFPQYYQPLASHLGMVTTFPALNWFFKGETIAKAYTEIINERGEEAKWYAPVAYPLRDWEKLFSLNGISVKRFRKLISRQGWVASDTIVKPIFSDGRKSNKLIFRILSGVMVPLAYMPYLEELFLGRVNYILTK